MIKGFFAFLRRLAGLEDDVERIVKSFTTINAKLARAAERLDAKSDNAAAAAAAAAAKAEALKTNADNARAWQAAIPSVPAAN